MGRKGPPLGNLMQARQHIDELSRKYVGGDYRNPIGPQGRIILKIAADKVNTPAAIRRR
jgi:hypothetical protein